MSTGQTTREAADSREEAKAAPAPSGLPVLPGVLLAAGILASLLGLLSSAAALVSGVALGVLLGNPLVSRTRSLTSRMLALSVMGLGAGMDLRVVGRVGLHGIGYTLVGITVAMSAGALLGRGLRTDRTTSLLLSAGTGICGGSAIAALAPVLEAEQHQVSVALGVVFLLNAIALMIFPPIGHVLDLSQVQFGLWSALAIHDTSSVVGSTLQYGRQALEVGTTVKLTRALWIVPLTFAVGLAVARGRERSGRSPKRPWFILGFVVAAALATYVPALHSTAGVVSEIARRTLIATLFLIGANLTRDTLRMVGARPLVQGVALWAVVGTGTLGAILAGWIH
jgi:uncharacterized integral membrane protein (TIGR00698 family)